MALSESTIEGTIPSANVGRRLEERLVYSSSPDIGQLKVSFFGPFYGGYNIIELDLAAYSYALVCCPSRACLWILSREPRLKDAVRNRLVDKAKELGFDTNKLVFVSQEDVPDG